MNKAEPLYIKIAQAAFSLMFLAWLMSLMGCSSTINAVHSEKLEHGCAVVMANTKLGAFNQEGSAEACKIICSEKLPVKMDYSFSRNGCEVSVKTEIQQ